ncbi:MAG: 4-hydroxy-tetrahydrodipicolinate synthase [Clostridia bacterium]
MIKGIFAPIPTPFKNDIIDYDAMKSNLEKWNKTKLAGVVVLGSNGEFAYLSYQEKVDLMKFVRENLSKDKMVIAGTGCESTRETIALSKEAAEIGCDAALVLTPHYYKGAMSDQALHDYFVSVADEVPIPIMLYNMPRNAGLNMSSDLVISLSKHDNIAGIKDSSGNIVQIAEVCANTEDDFSVFAGSGSFLFPALALGAVGGTLAVANIMPNQCVEVYENAINGNYEEARIGQYKLLKPNKAVTAQYGIAGLKEALNLLGYQGGYVRKPMMDASPKVKESIKSILEEANLI